MSDNSATDSAMWRRKRVWVVSLVGVIVLGAFFRWAHVPTRVVQWAVDREWVKLRYDGPPRHGDWLLPKYALREAKLSDYEGASGVKGESASLLRLLDVWTAPGPEAQFDRFVVDLDGQRHGAVGGKVPFQFQMRFKVPAEGELWLSLNSDPSGLLGPDVEFRVTVTAGDDDHEVLNYTHSAFSPGWENMRVDLSGWSGREIQLDFVSVLGRGRRVAATDPEGLTRGFWGDLVVRSRSVNRDRPNVVVVLVDTMRPDHLGAYGYPRETSPNMDALAVRGVRFDHAISSAPFTDPSIASLFTGLYPSDLWDAAAQRTWRRRRLPDGPTTLARALAEAGYFTMAASDHPGIGAERFGRGFDVYASLFYEDGPYSNWRKTDPQKLLSRVHRFLHARGGDGLLLYLHLLYPHVPYNAPQAYVDLFGAGAEVFNRENKEGLINVYDAGIRLTDDVIGVLLDLFEDHGLKDNTILAIVSDHGEGFWEHGLYEHGNSLYNELLKIPLILHGPGHVPSGVVVKDLVRMVDVMPTLLELVGVEVPAGVRGRSMVGLMGGESAEARSAYSEFPHSGMVDGHSIQSKRLKVIVPEVEGRGREIYDLGQDPGEQMPLVNQVPPGMASLLGAMGDLRAAAQAHREGLKPTESAPSEEMIKKLRTLGYTE